MGNTVIWNRIPHEPPSGGQRGPFQAEIDGTRKVFSPCGLYDSWIADEDDDIRWVVLVTRDGSTEYEAAFATPRDANRETVLATYQSLLALTRLPTPVRLLISVGEGLYPDNDWRAPMARALQVDCSDLTSWVAGEEPPPEWLSGRLATFSKRLRKAALRLDRRGEQLIIRGEQLLKLVGLLGRLSSVRSKRGRRNQ